MKTRFSKIYFQEQGGKKPRSWECFTLRGSYLGCIQMEKEKGLYYWTPSSFLESRHYELIPEVYDTIIDFRDQLNLKEKNRNYKQKLILENIIK